MPAEESLKLASKRALPEELLAEQGNLTAVGRFSQYRPGKNGAESRWYRDLLPLAQPRPGQQYAFEVDLDKCSGCKACVSACHSLNGLDEGESWRETGLLVSTDWRQPFQQTVTTACHHCVDPGCLNGCPVLAYDKDPVTGIVRHLDDQCIGCQYCVLKCPYDAPKYSPSRGIVRKCDLCGDRLGAGEAPACAQACPTQAIRISLIDAREIVSLYRRSTEKKAGFLPETPPPHLTLPSTRYHSSKPLPEGLRAADREELRAEPGHAPLAVMLIFSQLSLGMFTLGLPLLFWGNAAGANWLPVQGLAALGAGCFGLAAGTAHLGRPLGAWRSFLGWRKSWLSREIIAFGLYLGLAAAFVGALWLPEMFSSRPMAALGLGVALSGMLGVHCSVMVYHDTGREFWRLPLTAAKFFGSVWLLGSAGTLALALLAGFGHAGWIMAFAAATLLAAAFKLAVERRVLDHLPDDDFSPLHKTALLLSGRFGLAHRARFACGLAGGVFFPLGLALHVLSEAGELAHWALSVAAVVSFVLCLSGELIERILFFRAVQPVRMPGSIS